MDSRTFQEIVLLDEESLHAGGNVVQVFAVGHAIVNLVSGEIIQV